MPIRFACPSCARQYSVKDELAGKGAKCGQCGHKMKIPSAAARPVKAAAAPSAAAAPRAAKTVPRPIAKVAPPAPRPADSEMSSWLEEELESNRIETKAKPAPPPTANVAPASRPKRTVAKKRSAFGRSASLLRGTLFSFLAAMVGALVWAVLAYFTLYEFAIVAWGLGGLAGLGMALGHEDNDGTIAGIIAAFMSLVGIVAAKVMIVVIVIASVVSSMAGEVDSSPFDDAAARQPAAQVAAGDVGGHTPPPAETQDDASDDVSFGSLVGSLFGPIDGLFILLAFFTAYKVGSGQTHD
jgi:hypothetical protein